MNTFEVLFFISFAMWLYCLWGWKKALDRTDEAIELAQSAINSLKESHAQTDEAISLARYWEAKYKEAEYQ